MGHPPQSYSSSVAPFSIFHLSIPHSPFHCMVGVHRLPCLQYILSPRRISRGYAVSIMASPFLVHLVLSALVSHAISFVHGFGFGPHIRPLIIQRSSGSFYASPTRPRIVGFRSKLYTSSDESNESGGVRYLGSGDNAIIRPGVVLVAPSHEYDHFLRESAVFVYAIGLDDDENTIIRGESS